MEESRYIEFAEPVDENKNVLFEGTIEETEEWLAQGNLAAFVAVVWSDDEAELLSVETFMQDWDRQNGIR